MFFQVMLVLLISSKSELKSPKSGQPLLIYFNTIESDLEASSRILGKEFDLRQCAVGDKWLLLEAFDSRIKTLKELTQNYLKQTLVLSMRFKTP